MNSIRSLVHGIRQLVRTGCNANRSNERQSTPAGQFFFVTYWLYDLLCHIKSPFLQPKGTALGLEEVNRNRSIRNTRSEVQHQVNFIWIYSASVFISGCPSTSQRYGSWRAAVQVPNTICIFSTRDGWEQKEDSIFRNGMGLNYATNEFHVWICFSIYNKDTQRFACLLPSLSEFRGVLWSGEDLHEVTVGSRNKWLHIFSKFRQSHP